MKLNSTEKKNALKSLLEERTAVKEYTKRRANTRNQRLREAFSHAIPEEKHHAQLFNRALKQ